ncbi:hypothetical protein Rcae01_01701 [Novipirellula caenicola]|uniref:Uncharacterized protein n=1 Tax=Novipirellula caenicola TaxID=1536901 RepID=A0ABP9VM30_9BACT
MFANAANEPQAREKMPEKEEKPAVDKAAVPLCVLG